MKKIFFTVLFSILLLQTNPILAKEGEVLVEEKRIPSITIQFNDMDELSKEWSEVESEIEKEFDKKEINIDYKDARGLGGFIGVILAFAFFVVLVCLAALVFWVLMLIHAISKPIKSKAVWILILLIFGIIGAVIYYFAVKREFNKKEETVTAEKVEENK